MNLTAGNIADLRAAASDLSVIRTCLGMLRELLADAKAMQVGDPRARRIQTLVDLIDVAQRANGRATELMALAVTGETELRAKAERDAAIADEASYGPEPHAFHAKIGGETCIRMQHPNSIVRCERRREDSIHIAAEVAEDEPDLRHVFVNAADPFDHYCAADIQSGPIRGRCARIRDHGIHGAAEVAAPNEMYAGEPRAAHAFEASDAYPDLCDVKMTGRLLAAGWAYCGRPREGHADPIAAPSIGDEAAEAADHPRDWTDERHANAIWEAQANYQKRLDDSHAFAPGIAPELCEHLTNGKPCHGREGEVMHQGGK